MVNENINMINILIMYYYYYYSTDYGDVIYIDNSKLSLNINDITFYQFIYINGNSDNIYFINCLNIQLLRICVIYCKNY